MEVDTQSSELVLYYMNNIFSRQIIDLNDNIFGHMNNAGIWSPDSSAFLTAGFYLGDRFINLNLLTVLDGELSSPVPMHSNLENEPSSIAWSPDSEQLLIYTRHPINDENYFDIEVFTRQGTLIEQDRIYIEGGESFLRVYWLPSGLLITQNGDNSRLYYCNDLENCVPEILYEDDDYISIEGFSPNFESFVIDQSIDPRTSCHLVEFNIEDRSIQSLFDLEDGRCDEHVQTPDGSLIGYSISINDIHYLYIWDWNSREMSIKSEISYLIGWSEQQNGFLVAQYNSDGDFSFEIIAP